MTVNAKSFKLDFFFIYVTYNLDLSQFSRADVMDIQSCNEVHACKMEYQDGSEHEIIQIVQLKTYLLDRSHFSIADMIKSHPYNGLHTCKMEHEDDSQCEIIQT